MSEKSEKKQTLSLSKELIKNLPLFMDTAVESVKSFTGMEAKKVSHEVGGFESASNKNSISSVMKFKGDLEGTFILVFPKEIASKTVESLLGEKVNNMDELRDAVAEFCNIITGAIKVALSNKNIKVTFTLPKAYSSITITSGHIGKKNGIWIDMTLDEKPFYMFITK